MRLNRLSLFRVALIALFFPIGAFAATAADDCFKHEIDPHTGRIYQNRAQWEADIVELRKMTPRIPLTLRLKRGYDIAMAETVRAVSLGSDKLQHCYVGCRISAEAGLDVAEYAAYLKERKDILDCNPETHFEYEDIKATLAGATLAAKAKVTCDQAYCRSECRKVIR